MKKYIIIFLGVLITFAFCSCSDWLDVDPTDKNLEDKQFSTEMNINSALNGFYMGMASENLYGGQLTMTTIENLAHYYYAPSSITNNESYQLFFDLQKFNYKEKTVRDKVKLIWSEAYKVIMGINKFIANVENTTVVSPEKRDVLLGEAYALRAFLHFDMFRLFGPVYIKNKKEMSLPYNDNSKVASYDPIPADEFLGKVEADILKAEDLLKNDPILTEGILNSEILSTPVSAEEIFAKYMRNRRMNIIATKALRARVLAYADRLGEAAQVANEILQIPDMIEDINVKNDNAKFKWLVYTDIAHVQRRDYIFKNEILFSIENPELYNRWDQYTISGGIGNICAIHSRNLLTNIFNRSDAGSASVLSDARARQWIVAEDIGSNQYVSIRFRKLITENQNKTQMSFYVQPLMRISELYYIIIEDHINNKNFTAATTLINAVLKKRNYKSNEEIDLSGTTEEAAKIKLLEDILKQEYYREFYAEGQAFYFLKRRVAPEIFNSTGGTAVVKMDILNYVMPLPLDEINN